MEAPMTDNLARTIAALRRYALGAAPLSPDEILAVCDAAEAGLRTGRYIPDLHDTLNQIADALGCERNADKLLATVRGLRSPPREPTLPTSAQVRGWSYADTGSQKASSKLERCALHFYALGFNDAAPKINEDQLARDAVDQLRRMIAECYEAPHFALSRDEVDKVS